MSYTITGRMHSESRFLSSDGKPVFIINKDGCHVPEGVSADEAAQVVIKRLDDHIKNLVNPLAKENAQLKAKIADGIRVYAEREGVYYWECSEALVIKNATLLLDEDWDK